MLLPGVELFVIIVFCLFVNLFISRFGFKSGICLLIAPVPVHCFSITLILFCLCPIKRMPGLYGLSFSPCKQIVMGSTLGFSSLSDETLNRGPMPIIQDILLTMTYCDEAGDYAVPNVLKCNVLCQRKLSLATDHFRGWGEA